MICCESCKRQLTKLDEKQTDAIGGWYELQISHHGSYFSDYNVFALENCETHLCPDCMEAAARHIRNGLR